MGEAQMPTHNDNDNDIVILKKNNNDNDIVEEDGIYLRKKVLNEISEYKLRVVQEFMFGGPNKLFGDCGVFINPAIKQAERFLYVWMSEMSDESRKSIVNYRLGYEKDERTRAYKDYLNSPVWKYTSSVIKILKGYKCENCGKKYAPAHLVIHHNTYAHIGSELNYLEDVALLCNDCHMAVHGIRREYE